MSTTQTFTWWTPGTPKGQPRPRACIRGNHASMYDCGTADEWRKLVETHGRRHKPEEIITGATRLTLTFFMPRPQRLMGKKWPDGPIPCLAKPDFDNLSKAVADALTTDKKKARVGWWNDDSLIFQSSTAKYYHSKAGKPGMRITIETNL